MSHPPSRPLQNNSFFKPPAYFGSANDAVRLFEQGYALLSQGRLGQAREDLEKVVKINPKHFDALHLLGIIAAQVKNLQLAINFFDKAIKLNRNNPFFYCNRGNAYFEVNQIENALINYNKAIDLNPSYAEAYSYKAVALTAKELLNEALANINKAIEIKPDNVEFFSNRSDIFIKLNLFEEALIGYEVAINLNPSYALAYNNCGNILKELKRFDEALTSYNKAIELKEDYADAYYNRGNVLKELKRLDEALLNYNKAVNYNPKSAEANYNRGNILKELSRFDEALLSYDNAIELKFNYVEAYLNRGIVFQELKQFDEAVKNYQKAIEINPDYAEAFYNFGVILSELNRFDEALAYYDKAIELKIDYAEAYLNRGIILADYSCLSDALACYNKAIDLNFEYAYWNKSLLLLTLQDFEKGWQLYDWRWKIKNLGFTSISTNKPQLINLNSHHIQNKKILIWTEQGVGDQVLYSGMLNQFLSIAPLTQIMLDKRLLPLYQRSFPKGKFLEATIDLEDIEYDEHMPIGELGKFFRTKISDFDNTQQHYLAADPLKAIEIRSDLKINKEFLCGITWSSKTQKIGSEKSIQLEDLLPILEIDNITFVSLQYGDVQKQLLEFNKNHHLNIKECVSVDNFNDLDGHAALIEACDFVVTISNTTAHFAGAIGKETYLMYPRGKGALWYWSNQQNEKNLWYPSINIYQQTIPGQWFDVVQKLKLAIEKKINEIE